MNDDGLVCWKCGASLAAIPRPLSRYRPCPQCGADLYVCRLCRHFDPHHADGCREERAEAPLNKESANFCDWFAPKPGAFTGATPDQSARRALDALFGDGDPPPQTTAPSPLDDLFKK